MDVKNDFPMLNKDIIYFDNGSTTFKPRVVIDSIVDYYSNYSANAYRGDYGISQEVNDKYEGVRRKVQKFINAEAYYEIVFTSGCTQSLNTIVFGYFKDYLRKGDEILITKSEHASNILPWFELAKDKSLKVNYIDLNDEFKLTLSNLKKAITSKTKVISISHITNTVGDIRPLKELIEYAHSKNILVVVDAAQSIAHQKIDVQDLDIDFLCFSGHKMYGPTGIGIIYGKFDLLNKVKPFNYGGGMNAKFDAEMNIDYKGLPFRLEAGTQNIAGVIGLGSAIDYLEKLGIDKISEYEYSLKEYLIEKLSKLEQVEIYNKNTKSSIVLFNIEHVFAEDTSRYLDKHNICIRAGSHCAKILSDDLGIKNTCRICLSIYNTKSDIDKLVKVLDNKNILKDII